MNTTALVTTNLRMPTTEWTQLKVLAAEMGMSVNQYVQYVLRTFHLQQTLAFQEKETKQNKTIWDLGSIGKSQEKTKLSQEDEVIYA